MATPTHSVPPISTAEGLPVFLKSGWREGQVSMQTKPGPDIHTEAVAFGVRLTIQNTKCSVQGHQRTKSQRPN